MVVHNSNHFVEELIELGGFLKILEKKTAD